LVLLIESGIATTPKTPGLDRSNPQDSSPGGPGVRAVFLSFSAFF
jgi:hypothetical protein